MTPDPFRALDRLDPPDHWDDITRRAAATDDVDLDLGAGPALHPRRRAVALVAAAAVVALLAGGLVATRTGDDDTEGVNATDPSDPSDPAMEGPCPFFLDPELVVSPLEPGSGPPEAPAYLQVRSSVQAPAHAAGSWGTLDHGGIPITVAVYADADTAPEEGEVRADIVPGDPTSVDVTGWAPVEGSETCRTAQVRARLPLTDEDRAALAADDSAPIALGAYLSDPAVARVLGAVHLLPPPDDAAGTTPPADALPSVCEQLVAQERPTVSSGGPLRGLLADGRGFTVSVVGSDVDIAVDGASGAGGGTRPEGPGQWLHTADDAGILVGWLPPDTMFTGAQRPDGTVVSAGVILWPEGSIFALPDVGVALGPSGEEEPWAVVHCSAAEVQAIIDERVDESRLTEEDEALSAQIQEEAEAYQAQLACEADPAACPDDAAAPMTWEGLLVDGRTYRVEVDDTTVRVLVDGAEVNPDVVTELPDWPTGPGDGSASAVGFELTPDPDGGNPDWVLVGARPEGAVETWVRGPDGSMVAIRSMTLSPDGRFYALHTRELEGVVEAEAPLPVVHTAADGSLIELP